MVSRTRGATAGRGRQRPDRLAVSVRPIAELTFNSNNPRVHSPRQIGQLANSIKTFGFNVPVLVDATGQVIAGHGRVLAARRLGLCEVPTICLAHLTSAQARAFMIADNRLTEHSTWDDRLLAAQFKELSALDLGFDLEVIGFTIAEIDLRIEGQGAKPQADPADQIPAIGSGRSVSRLGDHWILEAHHLVCGNALDERAYAELMGDSRADVVFSDPPSNVPINGHQDRVMDRASITAFLTTAFDLQARHSREGSIHFICTAWRHLPERLVAGGSVYGELKDLCVWAKDNTDIGSLYRAQHELILVYQCSSAEHRNKIELRRSGRNRGNIWRYSLSRSGKESDLPAFHPTLKPVALVADAILDCSARGEIVLDCFLGSGTTLMAAERTGRRAYALEIDPTNVDTAIRRWQGSTGGQARDALTGRSFDELAAEEEHRNG